MLRVQSQIARSPRVPIPLKGPRGIPETADFRVPSLAELAECGLGTFLNLDTFDATATYATFRVIKDCQ
jgi:hypothetical protein